MEAIIYNNIIFYIKKNINETDNIFWERVWFIVKNYEEFKNDQALLINYSKLWQNYKFNECIYNNDTTVKICEMEANIYIK
jgi:hypothetical protein